MLPRRHLALHWRRRRSSAAPAAMAVRAALCEWRLRMTGLV